MTVEVETTRTGELARLAAEIAQIRTQFDRFHEDGEETVQKAREASTAMAGQALVIAARDQVTRAEANLRQQLANKMRRLDTLRKERVDLLDRQLELRKFIAQKEGEAVDKYERVLALIDQASALLDRNVDYKALDHLRDACAPLRRLPDQLRNARGEVRVIEARLKEIGGE